MIGDVDELEAERSDTRSIAATSYPVPVTRTLALSLTLAVLVAACSGSAPAGGTTASPAPSADIKQSKLDITYSAITENHYASPTSKAILTAALDAFRTTAKAAGATVEVATPEFEDKSEPLIPDFKKFAEAAKKIAAATPQVSADRFADAAILAMLAVKPDCHGYYRPKRSASVPAAEAAAAPGAPAPADEAGLEFRIVGGNVGYVTWKEFKRTGTYDITTEVKKALDALLAQGAKAWLFDLRANVGGDPPQTMTSWFLDGQPIMDIRTKTGSAGIVTARKELRLPDTYQLPMAVILNGRGGSSPEVFTLGLKENKRATVVGQKSVGCLGSIYPLTLSDGSFVAVPHQEFVGAVTGARYNNVGIPPDVPADDASAIDVATRLLQEQIAKGRP